MIQTDLIGNQALDLHAISMTQARSQLVNSNDAAIYHCINRCVRGTSLCGIDNCTKRSFEHRKLWVEARILELGEIFACGIHWWALTSNQLHLVVHMSPVTAHAWSAAEVAARWVKLYPAPATELCEKRIAAITDNAPLVAEYRSRLANLSWLMKSLSEYIARKANTEDNITGRFWEGRYKCRALVSEKEISAALINLDLNPEDSGNPATKARLKTAEPKRSAGLDIDI
jgi:hypothetical protein